MDLPIAAAAMELAGINAPMSFVYTMSEDGSVVISSIVQAVDNGDGTFKSGDKSEDISIAAEDIAGEMPEESDEQNGAA